MPLVVPYIATYQVVSEMKRWNASGRKVKFNDLRPGMLINGLGLIIEVGQPWSSRMYGPDAYAKFFPEHYVTAGVCMTSLDTSKEYEIVYEIGSNEYIQEVERRIRKRCEDMLDAERDVDLLHAYKRMTAYPSRETDEVKKRKAGEARANHSRRRAGVRSRR